MGIKSEEKRNQRRLHLMTYLGGDIPYVRPRDFRGFEVSTSQHILVKELPGPPVKQVRDPNMTPRLKRELKYEGNLHWQGVDSVNREAGMY